MRKVDTKVTSKNPFMINEYGYIFDYLKKIRNVLKDNKKYSNHCLNRYRLYK